MSWIDAFEEEEQRREDGRERQRAAKLASQIAQARANGIRETEKRVNDAFNAKHFDQALEYVMRKLMRERILEARRKAADYLRDYTDTAIEDLLRRPDIRGRDGRFHVRVSDRIACEDAVVNVVHIELESVHHIIKVCAQTGMVI